MHDHDNHPEEVSHTMTSPEEVASWMAVAQLQRRYGGVFQVIETHPGGGQYDCLSLYTPDHGHVADFNRQGRFHAWRQHGGPVASLDIWPRLIGNPDPTEVLDEICELIEIPLPPAPPPPSPPVLACLFIAEFLRQAEAGSSTWQALNGCLDTSDYTEGIRVPCDRFPGAAKRLSVRLGSDPASQPAYRFWFLHDERRPRLCVELVGLVWRENEPEPAVRLDPGTVGCGDIPALVQQVAGELLR